MPFSPLCGGKPESGEAHTGFFVIPQGEQWSIVDSSGVVSVADGPKSVFCVNAKLTRRRAHVANESQYLEVRFVAGHSQVLPGPASIFEDTLLHQRIECKSGTSVNTNEALVVYREELAKDGSKTAARTIVRGPLLYKPQLPSEWRHQFSWHGHDSSAGDIARKKSHGLKFEKLMLAPGSTYYDVENVRTADDALLTVRLMIFFQLQSVETMLDATNDPIADIINSVSSDVISFCSARSFEQFKETSEQLNSLGAYQGLVESVATRGLSISKIVFRGYMAPQRLQKMHDEAIERRTKLVLERESELQEQHTADERLAKEQEREQTKRSMQKAKAMHEAEMQRTAFEAKQRELREQAEQEAALDQQKQQGELQHLSALQGAVGASADDMVRVLVAREQGPPARLIQIAGDCKPIVSVGGAEEAAAGAAAGASSRSRH